MSRSRIRQLLLAMIVILYAVSIPWYRSAGAEPGRWLGLPDWVTLAVLCYVGVAVLNFFAWRLTDVEDPDVEAPPEGGA